MKLLICLVTHNRLGLTMKTFDSLVRTIKGYEDVFLLAADNASTDGTQKWLTERYNRGEMDGLICNDSNLYPGKACNEAWEYGMAYNPTHLMRTDNDMEFRDGWLDEAISAFEAFEDLGQLGLMNQEQEFYPLANVIQPLVRGGYTLNVHWKTIGGTHIMPRKLWDEGVRYDEAAWHSTGQPTGQEDVKLSLAIKARGFFVANLIPNLVWHLGDKQFMTGEYEAYYRKNFEDRGYDFDAYLRGEIR